MLIGKYKKIVDNLSIKTMNEVIAGGFIEKNDYDKVENLIGLPMKQRNMFKKIEQRKASSKDITKYIRTFLKIASSRERAS